MLGNENTLQHASLLNERTPNETIKYTLTVQYQIFYHCLYLQCKHTLKQQNVGFMTAAEGLYYYNNTRENSLSGENGERRKGACEREGNPYDYKTVMENFKKGKKKSHCMF